MRVVLVALATVSAACAQGGDAAVVTAPTVDTAEVRESTTSTGAVETTTTTTAPTTTTTVATTTTAAAGLIEIEVVGGAVNGGGTAAVALNEPVTLRVSSDVPDQVHVHGYDLTAEVEAGGAAVIEFVADVPGVFEVELESAGLTLLSLEVGA